MTSDPELDLLRDYRGARPAPRLDVSERVAATIRSLPEQSRAIRAMMAVCAGVCAGIAATLAFTALVGHGQSSNPVSVLEWLIDGHMIDVQSLLR